MAAQVTAMGIRDGDPAVLEALVNRRGSAVLAYCGTLCAPSLALDAAADAFTRFRATVLAADRPSALDPEAALLTSTRHAAASRTPSPPAEGLGGLGRLLGGRANAERLGDVPHLLAGRAEGTLDPQEAALLDQLLAGSPVARAIAERFDAAEVAYRDAPRRPIPPDFAEQIVATMGALAPAPVNGSGPAARVEDFDPGATVEWTPPDIEEPEPEPEPEPEAEPEPEPDPEPEPEPEPDPDDHAPVSVDDAVPDSAEIAAARRADEEDEPDPDPDIEWSMPDAELGEDPGLEHEIAVARLGEPGDEEDPAHLQSASGALFEEDIDVPPPAPEPAPSPPAGATSAAGPARPHRGPHLPGRTALLPALAVVAIAAVGAMGASGVFGGNDESPPLDTGIVPERALQAVPEGETATVVDDLRSAADEARRQRLADQRQQLAQQQLDRPAPRPATSAPAPATTTPAQSQTPTPASGAQPTTTP